MKKINTYSAQFKIISPKQQRKNNRDGIPIEKKLSKDRQNFINNTAASGFEKFYA